VISFQWANLFPFFNQNILKKLLTFNLLNGDSIPDWQKCYRNQSDLAAAIMQFFYVVKVRFYNQSYFPYKYDWLNYIWLPKHLDLKLRKFVSLKISIHFLIYRFNKREDSKVISFKENWGLVKINEKMKTFILSFMFLF